MQFPKRIPTLILNGKAQAVGALIFEPDGRLLMVHDRLRREWSYPAGYVDPGETRLEAVIREMAEEVNLRLSPRRFKKLATHLVKRPLGPLEFTSYLAEVTAEEAAGVRRQFIEISDYRWVTRDEARQLTPDRLRPRLDELFGQL